MWIRVRVKVQHIDPAELTPGEFVQQVRDDSQSGEFTVVVFDSLNGYIHAISEEKALLLQLHELLSYLGQKGVTSLIIVAQHGMLTPNMGSPVDVSYLADTVLLFRLFEHEGNLQKAISVLKRRGGKHDCSIRQLQLGGTAGIELGPPLSNLRGVFTGVPVPQSNNLVETML